MRSPFFFWTGVLKLIAPRDDHVSSGVFVILTANEDASYVLTASLLERMSGPTNGMCKRKVCASMIGLQSLVFTFIRFKLLKLRARTKTLRS